MRSKRRFAERRVFGQVNVIFQKELVDRVATMRGFRFFGDL
jgi:hypothetical protein